MDGLEHLTRIHRNAPCASAVGVSSAFDSRDGKRPCVNVTVAVNLVYPPGSALGRSGLMLMPEESTEIRAVHSAISLSL